MKKLRGLLVILSLICLLSLGACSLTGGKLTQQKTHNVKIVVEYNKLSFSGLDNATGKYAVDEDMMTKFTSEEAKIYPIISYADLAKLTNYFSTVADNATKILDRLSKEEEPIVDGEYVEVGSDEFKAIQEFFTERRDTYINYKDNLQKYNIISSQKYLDLKSIPQDSLIFISSENGVDSTTFSYKSGNIVDRLIQPVYKTFSSSDNGVLVPTDLGERQYINNSSSSPIVYTLVVEEDNSNSLVNFKLNSDCILEEKDSISTDNLLFKGEIASYFIKSQVENEGEDTEKVLTQKFEFEDAVYEEPVINDGDFVFNGFKEYTLETSLDLFEEYKDDNLNDFFNEIAQIAIKTTEKDYIEQPYKVKDGFEKQIYVYNLDGEDILVKECYQSENEDNNGKYFEVDENDGFKFVDGTLKEPNEDATAYELSDSQLKDYEKIRDVLVPVYRVPDEAGDFAEIDEATLEAIPKTDVLTIDKNANKVTDVKDLGLTDFEFEAQNMEQVYIKAQLNKILQNEFKYDLHGTGEKVEVEIALKTITYKRGNSKELTYNVPGITNGAFDFGFEVNQSDNELILSYGLVEVNRQFGVTVSTVGEEKGHVVVSSYAQNGTDLEEIINTSDESSFAQKGVKITELYCIDVFPEDNYTFNIKYNDKLFYNCGSLLLTNTDNDQNYATSGTTADSIWYGLNKEEIEVGGKKGIRIWAKGGTADNKLEIEYIHKDDATFSITTELLGEKNYGAILLDPNKTQFKPGELVTVKLQQLKVQTNIGFLKDVTFFANGAEIDPSTLPEYLGIGDNFIRFKMPSYTIKISAEFDKASTTIEKTINNPYTQGNIDANNGWIEVVPESVLLHTSRLTQEGINDQVAVFIVHPKAGYKLDSFKFIQSNKGELVCTNHGNNIISVTPVKDSSQGTLKTVTLTLNASFVVDPDYDPNEGEGQQGALVVTTPSQANCTVSSNLSTANANDTVTITVNPTSGYNVTGLTIKNSSGQVVTLNVQSIGNNKFTFTMPDYNISVYANVEQASTPVPTYTVSKGTVTGGTISFTNKGYQAGETVTVNASANTHFTFTGINFTKLSDNSAVNQSSVNYSKKWQYCYI